RHSVSGRRYPISRTCSGGQRHLSGWTNDPSFALIGLVIPLVGIGTVPAVIVVVFYAVLPILRNTVVGLQEIDPTVLEAAKGQGMQTSGIFWRVRMPLAWPVIITGIRVATQMSMGVAAIAAYV